MSAGWEPLTAADIAGGLRELADLVEEHGIPGRHIPEQALTITEIVTSREAVEEFAAAHGLPVRQSGTHTKAVLPTGRIRNEGENALYAGTVGMSVVHIADEADDAPAVNAAPAPPHVAAPEPKVDEPEAKTSGVDLFECPQDGCDFAIGAAGPVDPDNPYEFEEEVREHQLSHEQPDGETPPEWCDTCHEWEDGCTCGTEPQGEPADVAEEDGVHREAERCAYCGGRGTYTAHERYPQGGGGTNKTVTCHCPAGRAATPAAVDPDDPTAMAVPVIGDRVLLHDGTQAIVDSRHRYQDGDGWDRRWKVNPVDGSAPRQVTLDEIAGYPEGDTNRDAR
ncbi:hypothetical protein GCM10027059_26220 [Myceligenerans halotolerans]